MMWILGFVLGLSIGVALWLSMDNVGMLGVGIALGAAFGAAFAESAKRKRRRNSETDPERRAD